ncbi:hypothetical protein B4168_4100 [Anoxybacillus flavithermus]|nr:hypothetical protein B4168_4100 [Anoxybacillus flavithermus]
MAIYRHLLSGYLKQRRLGTGNCVKSSFLKIQVHRDGKWDFTS